MKAKFVDDGTVVFYDVRLLFRNFAGKEGQYNREGDRSFCVLIDDEEIRDQLIRDNWNVKKFKPRDDDTLPDSYIHVTVQYSKGKPPRVVMLTSSGRNPLDVDTVMALDWADIAGVDLIIRPYEWVVREDSGKKAYLKSMFVTISEDELELKYADVPEIHSDRTE